MDTHLARTSSDWRSHAHPLAGVAADDGALRQVIGNARFILIGEASHGTHEFYAERAGITRRLIEQNRLDAVVCEADWPDAWRVNEYVQGRSEDRDAEAALSGFRRFPTWMWRNTVVRDFVEWLRDHNRRLPDARKVGFYGMDLYSLFTSIGSVLDYLGKAHPEAASRARARYACFDRYDEDSQAYGYAAAFGAGPDCEDEVVAQLAELNRSGGQDVFGGRAAKDEFFAAQQNARLVRNAEEYYRAMFRGRVSSWNLRDSHMVETLVALDQHLARQRGTPPRIAVWAHNSHLGDASATQMGEMGEWNVGQLMRDRYAGESVLIGFSTDHGSVTAATEWDEPAQKKRVRPGLDGSYERLFHQSAIGNFVLPLRTDEQLRRALPRSRLQRAIGVIYRPDTERQSHYFDCRLAEQFDALIHIDETRALEPLEFDTGWKAGEAPETYPSGL